MNKSSKIIIALLIAILVAVLGFGGYYVVKLNAKLEEKNNTINVAENEKNSGTSAVTNEEKQKNQETNGIKSENSTNTGNNETKISVEDKLKLAVSLPNFDSMNGVVQEGDIVLSLLSLNSCGEVNVLKYNKNTSESAKSVFGDIEEEYDYQVFEYDESDVKRVAKEIFGVNLSTGVGVNIDIRDNNGKYYYRYIPADGEWLTIKNIEQKGNTYTFLALKALDSDEAPDSEFTKFQVVIEDGVIKSVKEL